MISQIIGRSNSGSVSATNYIGPAWTFSANPNATENVVSAVMPNSGTLQNFSIFLVVAPGVGTNYVYTVMKNGVATSMAMTVADAATTGADTVNTVSFVQGDTISIRSVPTGTPAVADVSPFFEVIASAQPLLSINAAAASSNTVSSYVTMEGSLTLTSATDVPSLMPTAGVFSAATMLATVAPGLTKSWTITLVKNGVDTAITTNVAGIIQVANSDNTHTVSVVATDLVYWRIDPSGTPATSRIKISSVFTPTNDGESVHFFNTTNNITSATANNYNGIGGGALAASTASATRSNYYGTGFDFKNLYVAVDTAPGVGKSWAMTLRVANVNTGLSASISNTAVAGNDTSTVTPTLPGIIGVLYLGSGTPTLAPTQWSYVAYRNPAPTIGGSTTLMMMGV